MQQLVTIAEAKIRFLQSIRQPRSANTLLSYSKALDTFSNMLAERQVDISKYPVAELTETVVTDFAFYLERFAPSTEKLYLQVIKGFLEFLDAEQLATLNLSRVRMLIRQRLRRKKSEPVEYPEDEIKRLIAFFNVDANLPISVESDNQNTGIRNSRDRALILTLADTGLRAEEICKLNCGSVDWNTGRATIIGRGNKRTFARLSTRAIMALQSYLALRNPLDRLNNQDHSMLPLFARHDKGVGKKIKRITPTTIRNIVTERVQQILGLQAVGKITPHTFLHYFVTTIVRATGNLKLAQMLARHRSIEITQKYAHLTDDDLEKSYYEIFENQREQV